ncbi:hypothetical protein [Pseudochrobactrum asaccharolyticum]|uniref:hypothetical protein n=1 Tax=Pseudochrobactrum asaccharolyticum TaxID=354351 RepID=UPI0040412744
MMTRHPYINGIDNVSQPNMVCVNTSKIGYDALNTIVYLISKTGDGSGTVSWRDVDYGHQSVAVVDIDELLKNPESAIVHIRARNAELTAKVA